jgi:hypothetical protein
MTKAGLRTNANLFVYRHCPQWSAWRRCGAKTGTSACHAQRQRFIEAAREAGATEDEAVFRET